MYNTLYIYNIYIYIISIHIYIEREYYIILCMCFYVCMTSILSRLVRALDQNARVGIEDLNHMRSARSHQKERSGLHELLHQGTDHRHHGWGHWGHDMTCDWAFSSPTHPKFSTWPEPQSLSSLRSPQSMWKTLCISHLLTFKFKERHGALVSVWCSCVSPVIRWN